MNAVGRLRYKYLNVTNIDIFREHLINMSNKEKMDNRDEFIVS